jgi:hypothetical protein
MCEKKKEGMDEKMLHLVVVLDSTYSLVHVDGVLARHDIGDGRALLLAGGLDGVGHF